MLRKMTYAAVLWTLGVLWAIVLLILVLWIQSGREVEEMTRGTALDYHRTYYGGSSVSP
jgi:hypothetical protein